jgi:hypothetical protein
MQNIKLPTRQYKYKQESENLYKKWKMRYNIIDLRQNSKVTW